MQRLYKFFKKLKAFLKMGLKEKFLFFEAFLLSGIARLAILHLPFKKLKNYMGDYKKESPMDIYIDEEQYAVIRKVITALNKAVRYTPWESMCLVQALVAQRMLKRRKIYSTLYLGVGKANEDNLLAHAWLRCGKYIVTGAAEAANFKEVARFSNYEFNN
ncbi:lasso peptide biosynthesis B2 protein [Clostridium sp. C8-1-8]|jgi:hypothetical protein|uniref:lasso peptide biosynthesis B2 protein n=1 Tax=Clostridium sp. C8-1-8 TaxID=2698831 RepID=UPI00136BECA2|nr:lasso peptide biosynthesis B2 protein [Clostridium sp. C8-1-8]